MRRKLAIAATLVGLSLGAFGIGTAAADPTTLNEKCRDAEFQEIAAEVLGGPATHGRCLAGVAAFIESVHRCKDPVNQEVVAEVAGVQANYGQCKHVFHDAI